MRERSGRVLALALSALTLSAVGALDAGHSEPDVRALHEDVSNGVVGDVSSSLLLDGTALRGSSADQKEASILQYLDSINKYMAEQILLLKWNSDGNLEKRTSMEGHDKQRWLQDEAIDAYFSTTTPSKYGKVAMLYNNDVADGIGWNVFDLEPPVPMMIYTAPSANLSSTSNFKLIPNPYDRDGSTAFFIGLVQNRLGTEPISFEVFQHREPKIVWRGELLHESRKELIRLSEIDDSWLDVADSKGGKPNSRLWVDYMAETFKYQIDIGGISGTSWDGLRWKMCASGALVFRVATHSEDWWHSTIEPWKHYIPVKADLSDLRDLFRWAEDNPRDAYQVALDGREACMRTSSMEYAQNRQREMIRELPDASFEIASEADLIFEKYVDQYFHH